MSKVEQALKSAIEAFELHAEQYPYMVKGYCVDALEDCKAALAELEKCEPYAWIVSDGFSKTLVTDKEHLKTAQRFNWEIIPLYTSPISKED